LGKLCKYANLSKKKLDKIRSGVNRQAPLGNKNWTVKITNKHDLSSTLNSRKRPKDKKI